jgi:hypothetical protein
MPALKASASAPAGSVKRKNGSDARLAIREMKRPDGDSKFIIHVAAVSCAATAVPSTRLANLILRKTRFRQALGVAFISLGEVLFNLERHQIVQQKKLILPKHRQGRPKLGMGLISRHITGNQERRQE